ncbi:MAG: hypothetical protein IPK16_09765 [Anaerolineales bacterium]|nr:hypothetical protein [Anaerolineales bacterium]
MAKKAKASLPVVAPAPANTHDPVLLQFAIDFFTIFGARVERHPDKRNPWLRVHLADDLAAHFGSAALVLYFHSNEPRPDAELVAHGSRIFDRMLAFLEQRSAFTVLRLPQRVSGGEALMQAVRPVNASINDLRLQEQVQHRFLFTWRITYRADDKRQEIYTVAMDQDGGRLPEVEGAGVAESALAMAALLADAQPPPVERNEEGHLLPPKLPPVVQLVQLAETARKYAIYHADLRCVEHEADILPRLHKALNRLTTYYQQQIEEVYDTHDPDGEKRRALEADLNRKIAEEVENHRLRVQVELVGYIALETPAAVLDYVLTDGKRQAPVRIVQDRHRGVLQRPHCYVCNAELTTVALDRAGHLICDACIRQCGGCQEIVCERCGLETCPVCGRANCDACGHSCWACGGRACTEHLSRCPVCGDVVCLACQSACSHCGVLQCHSHLVADCVAPAGNQVALICPACAVRCPGCHQLTAQTGLCAISGQRFCQNCLVTCTGCGKQVGPGFYSASPVDRKPYCLDCQHPCVSCGQITPVAVACHVCGAPGCPTCTPRCHVCHQYVCKAHGGSIKGCGHIVCRAHDVRCAIGGEVVCPACSLPCAICERPYCQDHVRACAQCGQEYCSECVRISGLCDTCATVSKEGEPVGPADLLQFKHAEASQLAPYYTWVRLANLRYTIYFGDSRGMAAAVVVVDHTGEPPRIVRTRRISMIERLRGRLGL